MSDRVIFALAVVPLVVGMVVAMVEIVHRSDLAPFKKTAWLVSLLVVPVLPLLVYVVARPLRPVGARSDADVAPSTEALVAAAEQHQRGELSDKAFRDAVANLDGAARSLGR